MNLLKMAFTIASKKIKYFGIHFTKETCKTATLKTIQHCSKTESPDENRKTSCFHGLEHLVLLRW
jgi:hypothetical protein